MCNLKFKTANAPSIIFRIKDLKITDRVVLFNLADLLKKNVEPTQKLLEYVTGISERTLNRSLKELEKLGFISRKTTLFNGKGKKTEYNIIWDKISKYAVANDYKNGNIQENCQNVENNINDKEDMGNFSGYNINNNTLEQTQETQYSPVGQYNDDEDLTRFPNEEDSFPPVWSEEKQCYMGINNKPQQEEPKFYDYCDEMGELLDSDDIFTINNILARGIDYLDFGKTEYEVFAKEGTGKIVEIANKYFNYKENNRARADLFNYVAEYNKDYKESIINKQNEYDRYEYDAA